MAQKKFDFEDYAIQQLDLINKKLDSLNVIFMPREEITLRFTELLKAQTSIVKTLSEHTAEISKLRSVDDRQQGSIDANRRLFNGAIAILGVLSTALFIYVTWRVGGGK